MDLDHAEGGRGRGRGEERCGGGIDRCEIVVGEKYGLAGARVACDNSADGWEVLCSRHDR
jgi:hypothetical protein